MSTGGTTGWGTAVAWWLWGLVVWCLLSVPAAVLLSSGIALRERECGTEEDASLG